jgi:hypothetical protein
VRPTHWVKPNETSRIPRRHIILDTETFQSPTERGREQHFRLAVASFVTDKADRPRQITTTQYTDPAALWADVDAFTSTRARTVLWAHNLAFDMRTSRAFELLPSLDWSITRANVHKRATWVRWRSADRSLVMVDSVGYFDCSLDKLGRDVGMRKLPLPRWGDPQSRWFARCERDVAILRTAVLGYIDWLRATDLGCWQVTGAGQSWAAWRHRFYTHKVLVHDDADALEAERRASWTGRAEAWRWGTAQRAEAHEFDLSLAYCRIAQRAELPAVYRGSVARPSPQQLARLRERHAVVADVTVRTDEPVVPSLGAEGILWPVGEFRTTLWDVELDLIDEALGSYEVDRVWLYDRAPVLRDWATWVLGQLAAADDETSKVIKRVLKHWSRALIGRFGMRYRSWEAFGTSDRVEFRRERLIDSETGARTDLLHVGRQLFVLDELREGDSSVPQITSYVSAACRAQLWRIMRHVPDGELLAVDTDSVIVTAAGARALQALSQHPDLDGLRRKKVHRGYEVRGMRNMTLGRTHRIAGVPRDAQRTGDLQWSGEVWQGLDEAFRRGTIDRVALFDRVWSLRWGDRRRLFLDGGSTAAIRQGPAGRDHADRQLTAARS